MANENFVDVDLSSPASEKSKQSNSKKTISFMKNVVGYFKEYCDSTSIHGFRYLGESRTICEKIWWLTALTACLVMCTFSILSVYRKWDTSPVIVTFATKGKSISEIPFPAVTVCSESKVKYSVFDYRDAVNRIKIGEDLTEEEITYLNSLSYVCTYRQEFNNLTANNSEPEDFLDALREVSPDFSIINCEYLSRPYPCEELFIPIVTDEGLCYTFNILDRKELYHDNVVHYRNFHNVNKSSEEWSIENGYREGVGILTYPKRALLSGAKWGLKFELKTENEQLDTMCRGSAEGYRILFHAAMRIPRLSQQYLRIPYNRAFGVTIAPSLIMTSAAVKNYKAEKRQCYFPFEKTLKYFNTYSQKNCVTECLTNYTLLACDCALFYMPRENGTRICNAADYECTQSAEFMLQIMRLHNKITLDKEKVPRYFKEHVCHCMPMCSDIEYKISSSQSFWNWSEEIESGTYILNDNDNITNYHLSRVTAYFANGNFIGSERNELYGPTDFLANFGGLLGLFTGFSVLSLLEIIYFLTLRLVCNIRLFGNWSG